MKKTYSKPVMKAHIVKRMNVIATSEELGRGLNRKPSNDSEQNSFGRGWDWDDDDWD